MARYSLKNLQTSHGSARRHCRALICADGAAAFCPAHDVQLPHDANKNLQRRSNMLSTFLLCGLFLLLLAAAPAWPYSRGWGYAPSGSLGLVLVVVLILMLLGHLSL
jgi:hypothetical protein